MWTFVLGYVILTVCSPLRKEYCQYYAMGVGFTILGGAFVAGRFSGAVFNPAVGVGVCLAAQSSTIWIYWVSFFFFLGGGRSAGWRGGGGSSE